MGATNRPPRNRKPPETFVAGPASGRIHSRSTSVELYSDSDKEPEADGPPLHIPQSQLLSPQAPAAAAPALAPPPPNFQSLQDGQRLKVRR